MKTYIAIIQIENQNSDRPCAKNEKKKTSSGLILKLHGRHTVDIPKQWIEILSGLDSLYISHTYVLTIFFF